MTVKQTITVVYGESDSSDSNISQVEVLTVARAPEETYHQFEIRLYGPSSNFVQKNRLFTGNTPKGAPGVITGSRKWFLTIDGVKETNLPTPVSALTTVKSTGHFFKRDGDLITLVSEWGLIPVTVKGTRLYLSGAGKDSMYYGGLDVYATVVYGRWYFYVPKLYNSTRVYSLFIRSNDTNKILHSFQIVNNPLEVVEEDEDTNKEYVIIKAINTVTEVPIENASVFINNVYKGKTNEEGLLSMGLMTKGTYSLRIEHTEYLSTDEDDIENDSFIVG